MQLELTIGDYYGHTHKINEKFVITVHSRHTLNELVANYQENVKKFGFTPAEALKQNLVLSEEAVTTLTENGMTFDFYGDDFKENSDRSNADLTLVLCSDASSFYGGSLTYELNEMDDTMVRIVMFFIGNGLEGFAWKQEDSIVNLNEALNLENLGIDFWSEEY